MKLTYTPEEIKNSILQDIDTDEELRKVFRANLNILGKIRAIIEAIARAIVEFIFDIILGVYNNIFIYTADEEALVQHLKDHGLESWKQAARAKTTVYIGCSELPDSDKSIPQLAIVSTAGESSDEIKQFILLAGGSVGPDTEADDRGYYTIPIRVESVEPGARFNVPADSITEFVTDIPGIDVVYNPADAAYGRDKESIEEVRDRIVTKNNAVYRGMLSWFVSETKEFSYVTDAVAIPRYAGRGTIGVAFLTTSGLPTQEQMDEVADHFNNDEMDPAGAYEVTVFLMDTHIWNADITVYYEGDEPSDDDLTDALRIYFEQLKRGEDIIEAQIYTNLISNVINIKNVTITSHSGYAVTEYEFPMMGTINWTKVPYAE